ncbi:MAG: DUF1192 domain-containing protein [Alphaproteobacteria bacterium]|jgi:uncharacterized small protein (DUF1192 family)|nr:DUF1192 domain-containing protein [Alphaproteobacteria bacterium]
MDDDIESGGVKPDKPDLQVMSIEELEDYIAELEAEIERVRAAIDAKSSHRGAADSVFKR